MRGKSKLVRCVFIALIALVCVLAFASCAPQAAPAAKSASMPAAVLAIPNLVEPGKTINVVGANFNPGEKVKVALLMAIEGGPSYEMIITYSEKEGQMMAVDANGSFLINTATNKNSAGVWPIRVYDEAGKMVASTAVWLKKAEKK